MAKIIVVTSGKGGVGKTTTSASFACGLALRGHKTPSSTSTSVCAISTSSWAASAAWCTT